MNPDSIKHYYSSGIEKDRLQKDGFKLEGIRTKEILGRYLSHGSMNILDVGGGAGFYSFWLQSLGHNVTLVDLSPDNIELVKKYSVDNNISLADQRIGDATHLDFDEKQFDLVLMMGPLYHLTDRTERMLALKEARRVLKPHGIFIGAYISRYASMMDGFQRNLIADNEFTQILKRDLETGIHVNHTDNFDYFTTAYLHTPGEIEKEIVESRLEFENLIAVEGMGWAVSDLSKAPLETILEVVRREESNRDILAASPHILGIARR